MRERHDGELCIPNLVVLGEGGVLLIPLGRMGLGFGRILGGVGGCFIVIPDLSWEMTSRLDSGMMCGVGRRP
jgi:hypothetical protein